MFLPLCVVLQRLPQTTERFDGMKFISIALIASLFTAAIAHAAGWESVHRYVKPSGNCAGREVLASIYSSGTHTASGERFDANGNTVAARDWPLGTTLTLLNPKNSRSVTVRVNDRGPFGTAYRVGTMLDLAPGAARSIGMSGTQYICVM